MQLTANKENEDQSSIEKWFEEVYHEQFEGLLRYGFSITENKTLAEDVVAEVFISLWNKRQEINTIKNLNAYLARSVRNLSIKKLKQSRREMAGPIDESILHHALDPEHILIGKELDDLIHEVMHKLTPHAKLVYDMAKIRGFSNDKIALELGITVNTVRKHLGNVLKQFKTALFKHYQIKHNLKENKDLLVDDVLISWVFASIFFFSLLY